MKFQSILTILLLLFTACNTDQENNILLLNKNQKLRLQEVYALPDQSLQIQIQRVEDSRCPAGVVCVWEGEASVFLNVGMQEIHELVLSTARIPKDTVQNYEFELADVSPFPDISREISQEDYRVTLMVRHLNP
ncbi:MAG: hypothetical protein ACK5M7_00390 [Draconibacterium sp.]